MDLRESGLSQEETLKSIQNEFGYDGIVAEYNRRALVAFNPEQIKSADPVTYDDNGDVIPLSERFNSEHSDIRYAKEIKPELTEGGKVESVMGRDARVGAKRASVFSNRRADMTVGQIRQMVARYSGEKVYTSKEARETIDNIAGIFTLSQKNRAKLYEAMWQGKKIF